MSLKGRKEKQLSFRQPRGPGTYNHFYHGPIHEKAGVYSPLHKKRIYSLKRAVTCQKTEEQTTGLFPKASLQARGILEKGILLISTFYSPVDSIPQNKQFPERTQNRTPKIDTCGSSRLSRPCGHWEVCGQEAAAVLAI